MMQAVMTSSKHIEKGPLYNFLQQWLGRGLLTNFGKALAREQMHLFYFSKGLHQTNSFSVSSVRILKDVLSSIFSSFMSTLL